MRYCLSLSLILVSFLYSRGQEFSYTQYNVKDGLAGAVVYCAAEDRDGFLWFGTEAGLSRFDGTHFRNFTMTSGLPDNEIIKLFVDSRNRVWIVPFRNAICYYQRGELHNQDNDPVLHRLSMISEIMAITEDKYGNIIMAEKTAIHIIHPDQKVKNITQTDSLSSLNVVNGALGGDKLFTFFSGRSSSGFIQYTIDGDELTFTGRRNFVGMGINTTLLSPDLNIYQYKSTLYCTRASGETFAVKMAHNLNSLSRVDDSLFTLNTTNGAFMYNVRTEKRSAYFLKGQSINAVLRDSESNLWFMCAGSGIFRIGSLDFRNVIFREGNDLSVTNIQNIDGALYIGTERSLLWRSDLSVQRIRQQKIPWHANKLGRIIAILPINKKSLLLGTDGCLIRLDHLNDNKVVHYFSVKSISRYKEAFLVSTSHSVELLHYPDLKRMAYIWKERSTCSYSQDSLIYFGTINGLYSIVPGGKPRFWGDVYPVLRARIAAIAAGPDGTLWIGTCGQGIAGVRDGRVVYSLTEKDGLTSNICRTISTSGDDIWVGTDKGLNRVHLEGGHLSIITFSSEDGLSSDIINTVYVNNDDVYVGSANGLTHFNIHESADKSFCKLRIISIQAAGHRWGHDTTGLVLPHRESAIRVDFAGISYRSAGDITYRYRLKGLNNNWQTTRETFLSYPTLPSGRYELEIIATNKFGVQSDPLHISGSSSGC